MPLGPFPALTGAAAKPLDTLIWGRALLLSAFAAMAGAAAEVAETLRMDRDGVSDAGNDGESGIEMLAGTWVAACACSNAWQQKSRLLDFTAHAFTFTF